jgi:hypothetical protein
MDREKSRLCPLAGAVGTPGREAFRKLRLHGTIAWTVEELRHEAGVIEAIRKFPNASCRTRHHGHRSTYRTKQFTKRPSGEIIINTYLCELLCERTGGLVTRDRRGSRLESWLESWLEPKAQGFCLVG